MANMLLTLGTSCEAVTDLNPLSSNSDQQQFSPNDIHIFS